MVHPVPPSASSAVCPDVGCAYTAQANARDYPMPRERVFRSTRSSASVDAHRDFDGFDPDEELARLRLALLTPGLPTALAFIVEATTNLDEWLIRFGRLPEAWKNSSSLREQHLARPEDPTFHG